jgi:hypothetical protein
VAHSWAVVESEMAVAEGRMHYIVAGLVVVVGLRQGLQSKGLLGNTKMHCTRNRGSVGLRENHRPR